MRLDELVERANALLSAATTAQRDGRIRPTLDARTVRYYQTLGIVPSPRRAGGRRAVYRSTHLVRAVVTKLLQAGGARLGVIVGSLGSRSDQELWQQVGDLLQGGGSEYAGAPSRLPLPMPNQLPKMSGDPAEPRAITLMPGVHLLIEAAASPDPDELLDAVRASLGARRGP